MQKQLKNSLFGASSSAQPRIVDSSLAESLQGNHQELERRMDFLQRQLQGLTDQWAQSVTQINEFIKSTQNRFEKQHQNIQRLEMQAQAGASDLSTKMGFLQNRLQERKTMDMKIQEMVDRYNSVLRSHEVRMNQMQKMLAEKEAALASAQAHLNETKMEIARLKRL